MPIVFACISPHPPIILPSIGSEKDRKQTEKTIESLYSLGEKLKKSEPDSIIISSPHPDWGIKVPLHFLNSKFKNQKSKLQVKIQSYITTFESPKQHFELGKEFYKSEILNLKSRIALIASGDLSHVLKEDGPYRFNPDGPKFDKAIIEALKRKDIETILKLDDKYPNASECGLRSICFMLGILEESKINYQPEILSYEGPFGVGYLVADFKLR